jgi:hypothetical protein
MPLLKLLTTTTTTTTTTTKPFHFNYICYKQLRLETISNVVFINLVDIFSHIEH